MIFEPLTSSMLTLGAECKRFVDRLATRRGMWAAARARAAETGKPLVVVGAPSSGYVRAWGCQYGCGDLPCVDLRGCALCGAAARDVTKEGAIPGEPGGVVVFVSYVLEYVDDIEGACRELLRAAGDSSNVFVAKLDGRHQLTRIFTRARWILDEAPPAHVGFKFHAVARPPRQYGRRASP